jgi:hypothetical protein
MRNGRAGDLALGQHQMMAAASINWRLFEPVALRFIDPFSRDSADGRSADY